MLPQRFIHRIHICLFLSPFRELQTQIEVFADAAIIYLRLSKLPKNALNRSQLGSNEQTSTVCHLMVS